MFIFAWMRLHLIVPFCCQVRKDLSITDAHASSSELQFPNKFLRIRKEECNRILKLKMLPRENLVTRLPSGQGVAFVAAPSFLTELPIRPGASDSC